MDESINIEIRFNVNKSVNIEKRRAQVTLTGILGKNDDSSPFYLEISEEANFRWEDLLAEDTKTLDCMLDQNAPALLLGYIRPIVANITANSKFGTYNIPFINFACQQDNKDEDEDEDEVGV